MIVLDTNVIAEFLRTAPDPRIVAWARSLDDDVSLTAITLAEMLACLRRLPDGARKSNLTTAIDAAIRPYRDTNAILAFDEQSADHYADIVAARAKSGRPISMADAEIAAICRARGATCATRNVKDFDGTGVNVINPWAV